MLPSSSPISGRRSARTRRKAKQGCWSTCTSRPLPDRTFDVVVVHNAAAALAALDTPSRTQALAEGHRVLRGGGRLIALEPGAPSGLRAVLRRGTAPNPDYDAAGGTAAVLEAGGFRAVRLLADREGYRFFEGLKT
jgi:SAM-dependent methyltransferase